MRKLLAFFFGLIVLASVSFGGYLYNYWTTPVKNNDESLIFTVHPGPLSNIINDLKKENLISSTRLTMWCLRFDKHSASLKIGEYELNHNMSPREIFSVLSSGKSRVYSLTIQEGLNMYEIAEILQSRGLAKKEDVLSLCKDKEFIKTLLNENLPSLEGYLYPETYAFTKYTSAKDILTQMVKQFLLNYQEIDSGEKLVPMNRHDAVILASIIEKETGVPEERGLVSSVFHNRLKKGMRLQTDPTIIYGIVDKTGIMPKNIRKSDLSTPNRYNTYTFKGLPYGPIANPGKESLRAAFNPEESEFLYFVSKNDGTHVFTSKYSDHEKAVRTFQLDRRQRTGKSWRDYSKKKN